MIFLMVGASLWLARGQVSARGGCAWCHDVRDWNSPASANSSGSPKLRPTNERPVGNPWRPVPFGTAMAGTPTRLHAGMSGPSDVTGYAWSNGTPIGNATVENDGATSAS